MQTIKSHIHTASLTIIISDTLPILDSSNLRLFQSDTPPI